MIDMSMVNKIVLIENQSYRECNLSARDLVDKALKRVCGAKSTARASIVEELKTPDLCDCVLVVPILLPDYEGDALTVLSQIEQRQPLPAIVAVQFLLLPATSGFHPDSLLQEFWINTIDRFYDQAIPTSFVALYKDPAQVQMFQIASSISSLFRDIDNIGELRRIGAVMDDLEQRISTIEKQKPTK